jgi:hypothetical protein
VRDDYPPDGLGGHDKVEVVALGVVHAGDRPASGQTHTGNLHQAVKHLRRELGAELCNVRVGSGLAEEAVGSDRLDLLHALAHRGVDRGAILGRGDSIDIGGKE